MALMDKTVKVEKSLSDLLTVIAHAVTAGKAAKASGVIPELTAIGGVLISELVPIVSEISSIPADAGLDLPGTLLSVAVGASDIFAAVKG